MRTWTWLVFSWMALVVGCGSDAHGSDELGAESAVDAGEGVAPIASLGGVEVVPLTGGIHVEKEVSVEMNDGVHLHANVFRPESGARVPVLVALIPYGKDTPPQKAFVEQEQDFNDVGLSFGAVRVSENTPFEAPDPGYWVPRGYAVIHVDLRGFGTSEGSGIFGVFGAAEVSDFKQIVEWAGTQPWSDGNVGLDGVSYLAISQWYAAGQPVPHLKAICPWEGASDLFSDVLFHGGIPGMPGPNEVLPPLPSAGEAEDTFTMGGGLISSLPPAQLKAFVPKPNLAAIEVPALICGSYSDQGLHTRGSFNAYRRIGSKQKWLYTHGGGKWERFYGEDGLATQTAFFDHFLKGENNGWEKRPRVRLEVRKTRDEYDVRDEAEWPLANTEYTPLFLNAEDASLVAEAPQLRAAVRYDSTADDEAAFGLRFEETTEVTGPMKLRLWVSTSQGDDMDLFVAVKKLDSAGKEVPFWGPEKDPHGVVAKGWLRVSSRELDEQLSTPEQPVLSYARTSKLKADEIVPVDIEVLTSSTLFAKGESLRVVVRGTDTFSTAYHPHTQLVNQGEHTIHTGGSYDSLLLLPIVR